MGEGGEGVPSDAAIEGEAGTKWGENCMCDDSVSTQHAWARAPGSDCRLPGDAGVSMAPPHRGCERIAHHGPVTGWHTCYSVLFRVI